MKKTQRQHIVKLKNKEEGTGFIDYLEKKGYQNKHNVCYDDLRVKVLIVDDKCFFSTNVTCLAAAINCGLKAISVDEFKSNQGKPNVPPVNTSNFLFL